MIYILASIVWLVFFITHIGPNLNGCKLCEADEPNYVAIMLLPRQHQIMKAGIRVREVSDQYFTIITMLNSLLQQTLWTRLLDPMRIRVRIGPQYIYCLSGFGTVLWMRQENRGPMPQQEWHDKDPSLLYAEVVEKRSKVTLPTMVSSLCERNILDLT